MRGKTYEVSQCTSWTTGRDKDVTSVGNVTLRATCSQNAWETKTYLVKQGVGLKGWGGLETAAGLDFPFHYLQRVCFSRRKTWETTSFSSLDREADSVKDDVCLFFLSQRKAFLVYFSFERCTIYFSLITFSGVTYVSISWWSLCDAFCALSKLHQTCSFKLTAFYLLCKKI